MPSPSRRASQNHFYAVDAAEDIVAHARGFLDGRRDRRELARLDAHARTLSRWLRGCRELVRFRRAQHAALHAQALARGARGRRRAAALRRLGDERVDLVGEPLLGRLGERRRLRHSQFRGKAIGQGSQV